jgi:sulfide:quinone oxidoreductase
LPRCWRRRTSPSSRSASSACIRKEPIELDDGRSVDYDFLVIATGPKLAFDEIEGLGPQGHTQSICHVDHAVKAEQAWQNLSRSRPDCRRRGAGASCYGPAYEFAMIMETDLRRRKIRDKVPMTFVTSEPYIGHLGLGGVGDSKGLIESMFRERHIKWICNAKTTKVEAGKMFVTEHDEDGKPKKEHVLLQVLDDAAGLQGRRRGVRHRGA